MSKLMLMSTTPLQETALIHEMDLSFICFSNKHLWDGKSPSDQYPYGTCEQYLIMSLLAYFQIAVKTGWQNLVQLFSLFLNHDSLKNV